MTTHRLLVIGVGSIGERHLRCAKNTQRAELSICEVDSRLAHAVADRYEISDVFTDFEAALASRPTAAVICTPAHLHVPMAVSLVEAGSHVLIEKPLSTSLDGIDRLRESIARQNVVAAVAYVQRCNPNLAAMRSALRSGRFGRPVQFIAVAGQNFPFYRPAYRDTYYNDRTTGGGAIQDALTHIVNAAEWLLGPVDRVLADAAHCVIPDVKVEDTVHVIARHGELLASYAFSQHQAPNEVTLTVVCEKGTLRYEFHESRWRWMTEPGNEWHDEPGAKHDRDDLFVAQLLAFFASIEQQKPPLCTLEEGLQTLRVNLGVLRSLEVSNWTQI